MSDIDLATATQSELKAYAINELDLPLTMAMKAETMVVKIQDRCRELNIEAPTQTIQTKHDKVNPKAKTVVINIPKSEKPGGTEPVPVGVQGVLYTIPRGVDIAVSESIVEVLKNAVQDIVTQDPETNEIYHEDVPSFPFQIVRAAA